MASNRAATRSAARLGAVQALYQMDIAQTDLADVLAEFSSVVRLTGGPDAEEEAIEADIVFLTDIVRGVVGSQRDIDPLVDNHLATGWKLHRVDATLRAILRAGSYELRSRPDVPAKVSISEYIDVARSFFDGDEPKVVNGVLDKLAREFGREGI
ncbi:MAG: transcription antitermination factor NusB [Hyphomicrobiales bacterium]